MARVLFHLPAGFFALSTTLSAQTQITTGVVQGTVLDSTGAVLPGVDVGVRKRFSKGYQLEANYVFARDKDDDSNERDPFTDRAFNFNDLSLDYSYSDRDIRHKFNFFGYFTVPGGIQVNGRVQARGAQPITPTPRVLNGVDQGRNTLRKDNEYFSFDWRMSRPFRVGGDMLLTPGSRCSTRSTTPTISTLSTPALFNFDGFLRTAVGDPRQVQLAIKLTFQPIRAVPALRLMTTSSALRARAARVRLR